MRRQRLKTDTQQAIGSHAFDRQVRPILRRKRFGEQREKKPKLVPVEPSQLGKPCGLTVGKTDTGSLHLRVFLGETLRQQLALTRSVPHAWGRTARGELAAFAQPWNDFDSGGFGPRGRRRRVLIRHGKTYVTSGAESEGG